MFGALRTIGTVLTVAAASSFGKKQYDKYRDAKRQRQVEEVHEFLKNIDLDQLRDAIATEDVEKLGDSVSSILDAAHDVREKTEAEEIREDLSTAAKGATDKIMGFFDELAKSEDFKNVAESFTAGVDKASTKLDKAMEDVSESLEGMTENVSSIIDEVTSELEKEAAEAEQKEAEEEKRSENDETTEKEQPKNHVEEFIDDLFGPDNLNLFSTIFANDETFEPEVKEEVKPKVKQPPTFDEFMQGVSLTVKFPESGTTRIVNIKSDDVMVNPTKKLVQVITPDDDTYETIILK